MTNGRSTNCPLHQRVSLRLRSLAAVAISLRFIEDNADPRNWVPLPLLCWQRQRRFFSPFDLLLRLAFRPSLRKLQKHERLSNVKFLAAVLPLSITAVIGIASAGWVYSRAADSLINGIVPTLLPTLFIGLAAIAVPHLLLHELADWMSSSHSSRGIAP